MEPIIELNAPRVMKRRAQLKKSPPKPEPDSKTHVFLNNIALRDCRMLSGLTQSQCAEQAGITLNRYSEYERKTVCVHVDTANAMAAVLGVEPARILRRTEVRYG